jgi:uncharacterized protein YqgC (DUF456 family)
VGFNTKQAAPSINYMECSLIFIALLLALICFVLGVAGSLLPALPGAPLIFAGILGFGFVAGFSQFTWPFILGQALLALSTFVFDYIASLFGIKKFGRSKAAIWGAVIGVIVGIFIGPLGLILGPAAGAILAELITGKKTSQAIRSGFGGFVGFFLGTLSKLIIAGIMIAWFIIRITPQLGDCVPSF